MRRGLYVLFEGLADTVIDSQVLAHVRDMRTSGIIDFEIWSFAWGNLYDRSVARLPQAETIAAGTVRVLPCVRPVVPFSALLNALRLRRELTARDGTFELIHARTDYAAAVCSRLGRTSGAEIVWDCRGDTAAEIEARRADSPTAARIGGMVARRRVARAAAACRRAIFVSDELRETLGFHDKPFEIIPCAASEATFFFDTNLRREARRTLGYSEAHRVVVYSGSLEFYQCFPESVALFRRLSDRDGSLRLLVLTPKVAAAETLLQSLPRNYVRVLHVPLERVNDYLNAADFALMLRRRSPVNRVASPTKFAEYCLAGLPVIMTDAVAQSHELASRFGNLILERDGELRQPLEPRDAGERLRIATVARRELSRAACRERYGRLYGGRRSI